MFTLDVLALNLAKQLYNNIFPWSDIAFYGLGKYIKYIILLYVFRYCFFIVYDYREKKLKKKSGESAK